MRAGLLLVILCFVALQLVTADRGKPGVCSNRAKREQCQCSPHGSDDCSDECSEDYDCYGQRKCCTVVCRRVCVLAPYRQTHACPEPNQIYHHCPPRTDPQCPTATPTDPVIRPPPVYPPWNQSQCEPRCVCRPGYVKTGDGRCQKKIDCPPAPPPNQPTCAGIHEIYYPCYRGCQASCRNPNGEGCVVNDCVRGCFCAPGFVRSVHGRCVRPQMCPQAPPEILAPPPAPSPPKCPENQEFDVCRRECEGSCTNPYPRGCLRKCQAGCFCKTPLVRDHYGNCVHPDQCVRASTVPPMCGVNEEYIFCSTKCQGTCSNPRAENCYARCQTGCFCIDGYVRSDDGACIAASDCPPPPPPPPPPAPSTPICEYELEEYIECHRGCQRTCDNPTGQGCSTSNCEAGCYCQAGLLRSYLGTCVPPHQCPSCGYHSHYEECGPENPSTCYNYTYPQPPPPPPEHTRPDGCKPGCYCDDGYVQGSSGGCVPAEQCRPRGNGYRCGAYEDAVPCGGLCERECTSGSGWGAQSCPPTCRRRCCRKRFVR